MTRESAINHLRKGCNTDLISDGYHTFGELYTHRYLLYIALCKSLHRIAPDLEIWKSIKHSDGTIIKNWFVLGIFKESGNQITYHLPIKYWDTCPFAQALDKAPDYDQHSSYDVLDRLEKLTKELI